MWKSHLAAGNVDDALQGRWASLIGKVHAGTAGRAEIAGRFPTAALFEDLRLAPYLRHCAEGHPDLADRLTPWPTAPPPRRLALVHGDVSPKNILCGPGGPILLDAECAWYGDPAFDLAFCSTHLLLKTIWRPARPPHSSSSFAALRGGYIAEVDWEARRRLEARAARLTAALLLARVDGKSPAEYLAATADRDFVRQAARARSSKIPSLTDLARSGLTGRGALVNERGRSGWTTTITR